MELIKTTYHGPTNSRGSRITASYGGKRVTVSYDHSKREGQEVHRIAAEAFQARHLSEYFDGVEYVGQYNNDLYFVATLSPDLGSYESQQIERVATSDADTYAIQIEGRSTDNSSRPATKWLSVSPAQLQAIRDILA